MFSRILRTLFILGFLSLLLCFLSTNTYAQAHITCWTDPSTGDQVNSLDKCNIGVIYSFDKESWYQKVSEEDFLEPGKGYWILLTDIEDQCTLTVKSVGSSINPGGGLTDQVIKQSKPGSQYEIWTYSIESTVQDDYVSKKASDDNYTIASSIYNYDTDSDGPGDHSNSKYDSEQHDEGYVLDSTNFDDTTVEIFYFPFRNYPSLRYEGNDQNYKEVPDYQEFLCRSVGNDDIDNISQNLPYDYCYFIATLTATGQVVDIFDQRAYADLGLVEPGLARITKNPYNWSEDFIVRLQLIDAQAGDIDITDPNTFTEEHFLEEDIREPLGQAEIMWYVLVEIVEEGNPNPSDHYPVLSWDTNDFNCMEAASGNEYDYRLIRGLESSGMVLIDNMSDIGFYQTSPQDGEFIKYFTILGTKRPEEKEDEDDEGSPQEPFKQIFPWPGISPGGLGWTGFPKTIEFTGWASSPASSGYPPGLSIPSFPGTYTGFAYPGGMYNAWTSFVPRFPSTFPVLGIFSPFGRGWHGNYWTGYPLPTVYQTGWFHTY